MPPTPYSSMRETLRQYLQPFGGPRRRKSKLKSLSDFAPHEPSFWELSNFEKAIDVLSRPMYASASAAKALVTGENPFEGAWQGFSGQKRTTYSDVLEAAGMDEGFARSALGFAGDILLDPTTYTFSGEVRAAGHALVRGVSTGITEAGKVARGAIYADKVAQATRILERLAQKTGKALPITQKAMKTIMDKLPAADRALLSSAKANPAAILGRKYGRETFERVLGHETRTIPEALRGAEKGAETWAIKGTAEKVTQRVKDLVGAVKPEAMLTKKAIGIGIPFTKIQAGIIPYKYIGAAGKPLGMAYKLAEKVPVVGPGLKGIREFVSYGLGAFKKWFSTKTAWAELNLAKSTLRDIEHTRSVRAARYYIEDYAPRLYAVIDRNPELTVMEREAAKAQVGRDLVEMVEGVKKEVKITEHPEIFLRKLDAITNRAFEQIVKHVQASRSFEARSLKVEQQIENLTKEVEKLKAARAEYIPGTKSQKAYRIEQSIQSKQLKLAAERERLATRFGPTERGALEENLIKIHTERSQKEAEVLKRLTTPVVHKERVKITPGMPEWNKTKELLSERPIGPSLPSLVEEYQGRMLDIRDTETAMLNLPPEERRFYFPHLLRPQIKTALIDILRQDAREIVFAEAAPGVQHALRRELDMDALTAKIEDFIKSNYFISEKIEAAMAKRGIPMSPWDLLAFEANPIVAGLKRELTSIHAVTSAEMVREILSSPTFVKSVVDVADYSRLEKVNRQIERLVKGKSIVEAEGQYETWERLMEKLEELQKEKAVLDERLGKYKQILRQHLDHAIYVPNRDYIRIFKTPAEIEELRRGGDPALRFGMFTELKEGDLAVAAQLAKKQGLTEIRGYILPRGVAGDLSHAYQMPRMPQVVVDFLRKYDAVLGWWKAFATAPRLAFHVRNFISNIWQNFLAGLVRPKPYMMAAAIFDNEAMAKMGKIGMYESHEVRELMDQLGITRRGFIGSRLEGFVAREAQPVPFTPREGALKGIPGAGLLSTEGQLIRTGIKYGTAIEDHARAALFIDGLLKGMDAESAALRVKKYLFDYADLTDIEKGLLRRIIPFYTWTRKSIPLAVESVITQPGKVSLLGKLRQEMDQEVGGLDHEFVADYITKSFGIPMYKNDKGEIEYFLLKGYIPTVDLARLDPQELLSMLAPTIKEPLEQFFNLDTFRMKPIAQYPFQKVEFMGIPMPARLAHFIRNITFLTAIDREVFQRGLQFPKTPASLLSFRTQAQNPVDQIRRFVMTTQFEASEMLRAAERAKEEGKLTVARSLRARAEQLAVRRDHAKAQLLKLDPHAFKISRKPKPRYFGATPTIKLPQPPKIDIRSLLAGVK